MAEENKPTLCRKGEERERERERERKKARKSERRRKKATRGSEGGGRMSRRDAVEMVSGREGENEGKGEKDQLPPTAEKRERNDAREAERERERNRERRGGKDS